MFQEYPKMLYREDKHMIVDGKENEDTARSEGWHDYGKHPAPATIKPAPKQSKKG